MKVDIFDFNLDKSLIANKPAEPRDTCKLLDLTEEDKISDRVFTELPDLLEEGDCLVFNDTKVIPAKLYGKHGLAEVQVTLYRPVDGINWWAFVKNAMQKRKFWGRPTICVCVPSGITEVERRAVEDAVYRTGARQVFILEEPMAAAIGAGVDIMETYGHMVVDIGAGTTDIAVISAGGVAEGRSVKVAGDDFNDALIRYLRRRHSLHVGELTAESTKMEIGSVYTREEDDEMEVKGKNLINGLPIKVRVTANETVEAFKEVSEQIVDAVYNVLEDAPPELVADIAKTGILLTGGGSLIYGMDKLIEEKTGIKVFVSENALETVATGAGNAGEYIVMKQEENREQD